MSKRIELSTMRKMIAKGMTESWENIPRGSISMHVDMTKVKEFIRKINEGIEDKSMKVTFNHVVMKVCAEAIKEYDHMNSSFYAEEGVMEIHEDINIGLAVSVDDGLVVPNIKDVGNKDYRTIAKESNDQVARVRANKLTMDDITGATFTVTNLGMMGVEYFEPIINLPEIAILGLNKIIDTPVVENGEIVIKPLMNMDIAVDHRAVDGAYTAGFACRIKELLETIEY